VAFTGKNRVKETEVLIIGAGLAGLSAGYHLRNKHHIIVESESEIGGLCKTHHVNGFDFDCTGHLIHFRTAEGRKILNELVGDKIDEHERKSAIYLHERYTDYPFQANTYGMPPEVIKDCLLGFVETMTMNHKAKVTNFYDWIFDTFGKGIAKHFMVPYNEKLWQHDLRDISLDWVNWSIPKPNLEDVINGALGLKNKQFGYNPVFYYPREGGIGTLPNSFPVRGELLQQTSVLKVNLKKRVASLSNGEQVRYRYLFSTMPLHLFLAILEDAPLSLQSAREKLHYISVLNLNLGVERENILPYHWVYFPETDKPFYRIGAPSNFCPTVAPKGTSSFYIEVSLRPGETDRVNESVKHSIEALRKAKILRPDDKIVEQFPIVLPCAYVIYDSARRKTVDRIQKTLNAKDVYSFGRYGSWMYSSMEDAVLQGKEFAEKIEGS